MYIVNESVESNSILLVEYRVKITSRVKVKKRFEFMNHGIQVERIKICIYKYIWITLKPETEMN